jgi:hypothetical protein
MLFAVSDSVVSFFRLGLSHPSNHSRYTLSEKYVNEHVHEMRTGSIHGSLRYAYLA